jgi:hypothetical protein
VGFLLFTKPSVLTVSQKVSRFSSAGRCAGFMLQMLSISDFDKLAFSIF